MKIVVTGITGFIGKNLLKAIVGDENQYVCLVRKSSNMKELSRADNIKFLVSDFCVSELTQIFQDIEVVIHMAGQIGAYGVTWEAFEEGNVILTENIVEACNIAGVKQLIYVSTPGVIGFGKRLSGEEEPYAPRNLYEQSKVMAEQAIIGGIKGTDYTILRPDFVYGPEDTRRIKMYKNIRDKKFVLTTSGTSHLTPTYVMDVVQGILKAVGNSAAYGQIINLSAETDMTVKEYLDVIADYFETKVININIGYWLSILLAGLMEKICNGILKRDSFVSKSKIDFLAIDHSTSCAMAKKLLGYQAEYDFSTGFSATMKWCEGNGLL